MERPKAKSASPQSCHISPAMLRHRKLCRRRAPIPTSLAHPARFPGPGNQCKTMPLPVPVHHEFCFVTNWSSPHHGMPNDNTKLCLIRQHHRHSRPNHPPLNTGKETERRIKMARRLNHRPSRPHRERRRTRLRKYYSTSLVKRLYLI
jgi:hypothetical protein